MIHSAFENSICYRSIGVADINVILRFWQGIKNGIFISRVDSVESLTRFFERNPELSFVATDEDGEIIGTVLCGHDGFGAHIYHMAIHPNYRRRGIGAELVRFCLEALELIDIRICHLGFTKGNVAGEKFWKSLNWEERSGFKLMHKSIVPSSGEKDGV